MDPILLVIIIGAALTIGVIWVTIAILGMVIRTVLWGVKLPVRMTGALARSATPRAPRTRRCADRRCTAPMPADARFCGRCGMAAADLEASGYIVETKTSRGPRRIVTSVSTRPTISRFA